MEKLTPDYFSVLEDEAVYRRGLLDNPDIDDEDKPGIERMAIARVDYAADVGRITNEQRAELLRILGILI